MRYGKNAKLAKNPKEEHWEIVKLKLLGFPILAEELYIWNGLKIFSSSSLSKPSAISTLKLIKVNLLGNENTHFNQHTGVDKLNTETFVSDFWQFYRFKNSFK